MWHRQLFFFPDGCRVSGGCDSVFEPESLDLFVAVQAFLETLRDPVSEFLHPANQADKTGN